MATIFIGTSGWNYDHWKGSFYPDDLKQAGWLEYYQTQFRTVEINNSFYQLPDIKTLKDWSNKVCKAFMFAPKANRYITHMKKLSNPDDSVDKMISTFSTLEDKLGPVLFQLPPNWNYNQERLESFLSMLPDNHRWVFEFRDKSWINDDACALLEKYGAAFCIYDITGYESPEYITADFIYVRLHGPDQDQKFKGSYSESKLSEWADRLNKWKQGGRDVFVYFNNDEQGFAPQNALTLKRILQDS